MISGGCKVLRTRPAHNQCLGSNHHYLASAIVSMCCIMFIPSTLSVSLSFVLFLISSSQQKTVSTWRNLVPQLPKLALNV